MAIDDVRGFIGWPNEHPNKYMTAEEFARIAEEKAANAPGGRRSVHSALLVSLYDLLPTPSLGMGLLCCVVLCGVAQWPRARAVIKWHALRWRRWRRWQTAWHHRV